MTTSPDTATRSSTVAGSTVAGSTVAGSTVAGSTVADFLARRWPSAVGVLATAAALSLLAPLPEGEQTAISAWSVLLAAVIYQTWGTARGELGDRRLLGAQTAAVLGFGAVAIATVAVGGTAAHYVLAAGWLAHAVWDLAHHRADRVVPRWYAETCLVSDVLVATVLLATA